MKAKTNNRAKAEEKQKTNDVTMKAYKELAERGSKKEDLSAEQKAIIKEAWKRQRERKKTGLTLNPEQEEERWAKIFK